MKGIEAGLQMVIFALIIILIVAVAVFIAYQAFLSGGQVASPGFLENILTVFGGGG